MSVCKQFGKDKVIFLTKEDHEKPSTVTLPEDDDEPRGLILPNGEINWNCPCLGGMASGPCGIQFREAFSCFHYSTKDENKEKGSECIEKFVAMHECMSKYPNVYPRDKDDEEDSADFQKMVDDDPGKRSVESEASTGSSITDNSSDKQLKS